MKKTVGSNVAKQLADFVNPMNCDFSEFLDEITLRTHRTLQQTIGKLILQLIKRWAEMYKSGTYDLRNESICKTSYNIVNMMYIAEENEYWDNLPTI